MKWVIFMDIIIWGTLIWYFSRDKRTNNIIFFIMMTYLTIVFPVLLYKVQ